MTGDINNYEQNLSNRKVEQRIELFLRIGIYTAATLMAVGLVIAAFQRIPDIFGMKNLTLNEFIVGLNTNFQNVNIGTAIPVLAYAGITVLILTPFLRVIVALTGFTAERDWKFAGVALFILLLLVGEVLYALKIL
jgi:uncharacterized membrane protein